MIAWKTTTQPVWSPVSVALFKTHTRIDVNDEDEVLTRYLEAAREFCERRINSAIAEQTITAKLDAFPASDRILLPHSRLIDVDSVTYLDNAGVVQTLHSTGSPQANDYGVDTFSDPGALYLRSGQAWPTDLADERQPITIVYRAGWQSAAAVPPTIKQAIFLIAAHWVSNREAVSVGQVSSEVDFSVTALLDQWRVMA